MRAGKRPSGMTVRALAMSALAAALAAGADVPATTTVGGPVLGYVFDGAVSGIRQVTGIPGAALLTEPVPLGVPLAGAVSVWPDCVLAIAETQRQVQLLELSPGAVRARTIAGLAPGPDDMVLSPAGHAAVLLYRRAARVAVVTGLPGASQMARQLEVPQGPITAAVNDDASLVAVAYDFAVLISFRTGESRWVLTLGRPAALAFSHSGRDLLLADIQNHAVHWIGDVGGALTVVRLAGERDGIASPVGVAFSSDDRGALVANAGADTLAVVDLESGKVSRTPSRAKPTGLYPLGGGVYSFRAPAPLEPLWLYAARAARSRMFFAPPELKAPAASGARSEP